MRAIRHEVPSSEAARKLRVLVQRHSELSTDISVRRNRLTSLCDELFPEFTQIFADPNKATALAIREKFPTPADIAVASLDDLCACRESKRPSKDNLKRLKDEIAPQSIGITDPSRLYGLVLEQAQLIAELRIMRSHLERLKTEIEQIISDSREGQILMSIPGIGVFVAAGIVASIGSIAKFESPARLRAYCGWSPKSTQTGKTKDAMTLAKGGNKILKQAIFFATFQSIKEDTEMKAKYDRLVRRKCSLDLRTGEYKGKMKCVGRIAGDIITLIYVLLKKDADLLAALPPGAKPPEPSLYDRAIHKKHRLRGKEEPPSVVLVGKASKRSEVTSRIHELLAENPGIKVGKLAEMAGCARNTAGRIRKQWLEENLFKQQPVEEVHETDQEASSPTAQSTEA